MITVKEAQKLAQKYKEKSRNALDELLRDALEDVSEHIRTVAQKRGATRTWVSLKTKGVPWPKEIVDAVQREFHAAGFHVELVAEVWRYAHTALYNDNAVLFIAWD